jgi:hypothetical protein
VTEDLRAEALAALDRLGEQTRIDREPHPITRERDVQGDQRIILSYIDALLARVLTPEEAAYVAEVMHEWLWDDEEPLDGLPLRTLNKLTAVAKSTSAT